MQGNGAWSALLGAVGGLKLSRPAPIAQEAMAMAMVSIALMVARSIDQVDLLHLEQKKPGFSRNSRERGTETLVGDAPLI